MRIRLNRFTGEAPRLDPMLLPQENAAKAVNCKLTSGALEPWAAPRDTASLPKRGHIGSIRLLADLYWLHWTGQVRTVRAPVAGDLNERTVISGLDAPRLTDTRLAADGQGAAYPLKTRLLGIPAPEAAPQLSLGSGGEGEPRSLAYVTTFVNDYDEEGPPSPASNVIETRDGQAVHLYGLPAVPAGDWMIGKRRIYRTHTPADGNALWRFVAEVDADAASFTDTVRDADLNESLASAFWYPPPKALRGIIALPGGFLAGFSGNELCFSEPHRPWAWPPQYRLVTDHPIKALGSFGNTVVAATTACPHLATGTHPSGMSLSRLPDPQPCLSAAGLVSFEDGVAYPAPGGLYMVGPKGGKLVTRSLISRGDWQAMNPESMHGVLHDGRYFGFFRRWKEQQAAPPPLQGALAASPLNFFGVNGSLLDAEAHDPPDIPGAGFILDLSGEGGLTMLDFYAYAAFADPEKDRLFLAMRENGANSVRCWDAGDVPLPYTWRSRPFVAESPVNMAAARLDADFDDASPVTFSLIADGQIRAVKTVTSSRPFRLPGGYRARRFEAEVSGTVPVRGIALATSPDELED